MEGPLTWEALAKPSKLMDLNGTIQCRKPSKPIESKEILVIRAEGVGDTGVFFEFQTLKLTENQVLQLQEMKVVRSPRHEQEEQVFLSLTQLQEGELVSSPRHGQGLRFETPEHVQQKELDQQHAKVQEIEPLPSPSQVQELTEYLIAHELWQVPDSVLYEEPAPVVDQCELETCLEIDESKDATDGIEVFNAEDCAEVNVRKRGRRHKQQFMKRPMALSEVIEELQNHDLRENALRCLSGHLVDRREHDPEFYLQAGFYLYHSCSTMVILIQEILFVYERLNAGDLNVRRSKRLANVLCLLQSIATNKETRLPFVKACLPNYLIPFILSEYTEEVYEHLRALSLSVISILCQAREKEVIQWALENDIIEVCFQALDIGSELSKVVRLKLNPKRSSEAYMYNAIGVGQIAMTILDAILRDDEGLLAICEPSGDLLPKFIKLCADLVSVLAIIQGFSPRLLFLVVRSFILLCQNCRALELLKDELPTQLQDTTFSDVKMEYPLFRYLRHQLLLFTGKATFYLPSVEPSPTTPVSSRSSVKDKEDDNSSSSLKRRIRSVVVSVTPIRPIDLNKQDWSFLSSPIAR